MLAASVHDNAGGGALLDKVAAGTEPDPVKKALVDQGFKTAVADHGQKVGIEVEKVQRNPADTGCLPQLKRGVVEQTNGAMMLHRGRCATTSNQPASTEPRVCWAISDRMSRMLTKYLHPHLARRMAGDELTLGAVLARLEEQEREIAAQADAPREKIAELTALLAGFDTAAEENRITRKTLLALPDLTRPTPPALKLPNHPDYQQIMTVFAAADGPCGPGRRARR